MTEPSNTRDRGPGQPQSPPRPWMRHAIPAAMALACGLFIALSGASLVAKIVAAAIFFVAASLWSNARELRLHATINRYSALGQPEAILALVEPELAYSRTARIRVPFSIYKALALSLQGHWSQALATLDDIDIRSMRGKTRRTWQFLYYSHRLTCLLFNDRVAEARAVLDNHIEPFTEVVTSPGTRLICDESRAKLAYFEGRHDDAEQAFQSLAARGEIAPASRAIYYYFLGLLARVSDQDPGPHFDKASQLAPYTFLPAAIGELAGERADPPESGPIDDQDVGAAWQKTTPLTR